jgi:hypothetical protein
MLILSPARGQRFVVSIPYAQVNDNFYIAFKLNDIHDTAAYEVGFWQGEYLSNQSHTFIGTADFAGGEYSNRDGVFYFDGLVEIAAQEGRRPNRTSVIALERKDGEYNFYIDDQLRLSHSVIAYGTQIGLIVSTQSASQIEIDYLLMR